MQDDLRYFLLKSGIAAAKDLSAENTSLSRIEFISNLFHCFQELVTSMSIYTLNPETENMEEVVVIDSDGANNGMDNVPVYQLPEEVLKKLQAVQIETNGNWRTLIPLHQDGFLIGFIELHTQNVLEESIMEAFCDMASALSLGVHIKSYKEKAVKERYLFDAVMHINKAIQSCSDIDELIQTFAKLTIEFLKFDRITVFTRELYGYDTVHNFCVNAKGEMYILNNSVEVPYEIQNPQHLEDLSGFWVPIRFKDKTIGIMLADNIYTLCEIPKDSITILSDLCTQLALSIEHLHLINKINRHAQYDDLTGVLNRRMSIEAIEHNIALSKRCNSIFTLCYIDMNHMKYVNDSFGHAEGDVMLRKFTEIIREHIRQNDVIGRMGGDEFMIIFPMCDISCAEKIWDRIKTKIDVFNSHNLLPFKMSASHGMAQFDAENECSPAQLILIADQRMYKEKELRYSQLYATSDVR